MGENFITDLIGEKPTIPPTLVGALVFGDNEQITIVKQYESRCAEWERKRKLLTANEGVNRLWRVDYKLKNEEDGSILFPAKTRNAAEEVVSILVNHFCGGMQFTIELVQEIADGRGPQSHSPN